MKNKKEEIVLKIVKSNYEIITKINREEILKTIEIVGRTCYKSEDKITEDSAIKFIKMLIKNGHEAMIEHFSISIRFTNDRGVSHEEVRHRIASFGQESTRYCNYSKDKFGNEITYIDINDGIKLDQKMRNMPVEQINLIINEWLSACKDAENHYFKMLELGATPQIARSVLNNSTKTEIVITMNLREWRHFFKLRCSSPAHPQMREVTLPLFEEMKELLPEVFEDIVLK
jgi:thymidylate synthase (FAD)